jgi:hypothetical protein
MQYTTQMLRAVERVLYSSTRRVGHADRGLVQRTQLLQGHVGQAGLV